jgi:hypothetical protein
MPQRHRVPRRRHADHVRRESHAVAREPLEHERQLRRVDEVADRRMRGRDLDREAG